MRQLLLSMAVVTALTFGVSSTVDARGPSGHSHGHSSHGISGSRGTFRSFPNQHAMHNHGVRTVHHNNFQYHNAHLRYGTRFNHGYYFRTRPAYWGGRQWNRQYNCWTYWCSLDVVLLLLVRSVPVLLPGVVLPDRQLRLRRSGLRRPARPRHAVWRSAGSGHALRWPARSGHAVQRSAGPRLLSASSRKRG